MTSKNIYQTIKEKAGKAALTGLATLSISGCAGRDLPTPSKMGCSPGFTVSREAVNGGSIIDFDCDGSIDVIRALPSGSSDSYTDPYILMISPSFLNGRAGVFHHPHGVVVMTPRMQELADSIYSFQKQLYFLEDSTRYWANMTGDTTNLTGSTVIRTQGEQ